MNTTNMKFRVTNIDWDADEDVDLPEELVIELNSEYISPTEDIEDSICRQLSDTYGLKVESVDFEELKDAQE